MQKNSKYFLYVLHPYRTKLPPMSGVCAVISSQYIMKKGKRIFYSGETWQRSFQAVVQGQQHSGLSCCKCVTLMRHDEMALFSTVVCPWSHNPNLIMNQTNPSCDQHFPKHESRTLETSMSSKSRKA